MKILIYSDPHFSQNSSMLIGKDGKYSKRLSNLIKTFKWINQVASDEKCDYTYCLGDMTDRPDLTAEEITAMSECNLQDHRIVVGNHCRSDKDGEISSLAMFNTIYNKPDLYIFGEDPVRKILVLPYNSTPYDLDDYGKVDIILSHNDIKGYDFGGRVSTEGYEISDILDHCTLFINGHLHNGGWLVESRIMNVGQVTGMNFSSCGGQWEPSAVVLNTDDLSLKFYENPEAFRFKKEEFSSLTAVKNYLTSLPEVGHYVIQAKVPESAASSTRQILDKSPKVVTSRVIVSKSKKSKTPNKSSVKLSSTSIYDKLRGFIATQNKSKFNEEVINKIITKIEGQEGVE